MLVSSFVQIHQPHSSYLSISRVQIFSGKTDSCRQKTARISPCHCEIAPGCATTGKILKFGGFGENPDAGDSELRFIEPDVLASVLQPWSNGKELRSIHAVVVKSLGRSVRFVNNNLLSGYVRFGELGDARKVFDGMAERDIVSWTSMLNGYLKIGLEVEALKFFSCMVRDCIRFNAFTLACVLSLSGRSLDLKLGEQIHAHVVKNCVENLIVNSSLVYFYSSFGDLSSAFRVFDGMPERDVICWTTLISACAQHGLGYEAMLEFSCMQEEGFRPNEFTVCSVLKACGQEKALNVGRQLHTALVKKTLRHDVFVGSSLLGMYAKCGEISDARTVFDKMPKRNTVTWTSMIAGYAQNGFGEEAIILFRRMNRRRVYANNLTVVGILSACGLVRSLHLGKELHAKILKMHIEKSVYIGSTLTWFYCRCGEYSYARHVLSAMPFRDVVSWTAMVSGHALLGNGLKALEFLNTMLLEGVEPNPFTYSSALKACSELEAVKEGKWLHASANKTSGLSNVYVGNALINLYAKCGMVEDAFRVFDRMPDRNLVVWTTMILGYARNGMCRDALKLMYRMQAEGIKVDDYVVATVLNACGDVKWDSQESSQYSLTCI